MKGTDIIILLTVAVLIGGAVWKIIRDKKKGVPCSGCSSCPMAGSCDASVEKSHTT